MLVGLRRSLASHLQSLTAQHEPKAILDALHQLATELARRFAEEVAINGHDLRHVDDRVPGKARGFRRNQDIAGRINQPEIRGQDNSDDCADAASIERIVLNNQKWPTEAGLGATGFVQVGPPDLTSFDYHLSRPTVFDWACRSGRSSCPGSSA
jgi:hypothetical protein